MGERVVAPSAGLQRSYLAQSRIIEVVEPLGDQPVGELGGTQSATPDLPPVVDDKPGLGDAQVTNGGQLAQLSSPTDGQSALLDDDKIIPSGAHFTDPFIDPLLDGSFGPLPHGSLSLAQFGQEENGSANFFGGGAAPSQQIFSTSALTVVNSIPGGIVIPAPGGAATQVFEAGLGPRGSEPAGSHTGNPLFPITTQPGSIGFTSADGVATVSLGGHMLTTSPQTFPDGATGSLTAFYTFDPASHQGTIHYTYRLLDNTLGVPNTSFAVVITDPQGDSSPAANLVINIVDDTPVAKPDADIVASGQTTPETGNVLTGAGTAGGPTGPGVDVQGADGGEIVVGVAKGIGAGGANPATVGVAIQGDHGTLTLNADGTYSYVHATGGSSDVFTYTVKDADGSLSHATLTIVIGNSAPGNFVIPPSDTPGQTQVFEAGLPARTINGTAEPAGSNPRRR